MRGALMSGPPDRVQRLPQFGPAQGLQAIGYRMLQLLALPLETLGRAELRQALDAIGRA